MPYNFVADSIHTKKLCSRLSSSEVQFYTENGHFELLNPFWGLDATYAVHLRLIGKRVVDFLLVIIEHFSLGVTAEALYRLNERGQFGPRFQVQGVVPYRTFFL